MKLEYENELKNVTLIYQAMLSSLNETFHLYNEEKIQKLHLKLNYLEDETENIAKMNSNFSNHLEILDNSVKLIQNEWNDYISGKESKLHLLKDQMDSIKHPLNKTYQRLDSEINNLKNKTNKIINFFNIMWQFPYKVF